MCGRASTPPCLAPGPTRRLVPRSGADLQRLELCQRMPFTVLLIVWHGAVLQQCLRMGQLRLLGASLHTPKLAGKLAAQAPHNCGKLRVRVHSVSMHAPPLLPLACRIASARRHTSDAGLVTGARLRSKVLHARHATWLEDNPVQGITWSCSLSCPPPAAPWCLCTSDTLPCDARSLAYEFP